MSRRIQLILFIPLIHEGVDPEFVKMLHYCVCEIILHRVNPARRVRVHVPVSFPNCEIITHRTWKWAPMSWWTSWTESFPDVRHVFASVKFRLCCLTSNYLCFSTWFCCDSVPYNIYISNKLQWMAVLFKLQMQTWRLMGSALNLVGVWWQLWMYPFIISWL